MEMEFRFRFKRYGIDVPVVKPYSRLMTKLGPRPLRADARRNRERVLKAAQATFAEHGREAQMDDVARRAGVGVGTVYRHFPTKEALVEALATSMFERVLAGAREALEHEDPWQGFVESLWAGGKILASDRAFTEIVGQVTMPVAEELVDEMQTVYDALIRRAQEAGALRPDVVLDDIPMLMCGIGSATQKAHCVPDAWKRHLAIVIDGLRAANASGTLPA
jgi:AcrR family transcriptional regulator